jgi:hypothetical protein
MMDFKDEKDEKLSVGFFHFLGRESERLLWCNELTRHTTTQRA